MKFPRSILNIGRKLGFASTELEERASSVFKPDITRSHPTGAYRKMTTLHFEALRSCWRWIRWLSPILITDLYD
jgi:hypothetical protein